MHSNNGGNTTISTPKTLSCIYIIISFLDLLFEQPCVFVSVTHFKKNPLTQKSYQSANQI